MKPSSESEALARLQRLKTSYQNHIRRNYEHEAEDCRSCPTRGVCCTDAHFVNVHITRLEAVAIRETLLRTPRLSEDEKMEVYLRAEWAVKRYDLRTTGDTFARGFACPLYNARLGCLVHRRAKPAPCIQHACYHDWTDLPPHALQERTEYSVEKLNAQVYGAAWAWLPLPLWLTLVDPRSDGSRLENLAREWSVHTRVDESNSNHHARRIFFHSHTKKRRSLPVIN